MFFGPLQYLQVGLVYSRVYLGPLLYSGWVSMQIVSRTAAKYLMLGKYSGDLSRSAVIPLRLDKYSEVSRPTDILRTG